MPLSRESKVARHQVAELVHIKENPKFLRQQSTAGVISAADNDFVSNPFPGVFAGRRRCYVLSPKVLAEHGETHAAGLRLLARSRCNSAEDCVQEAFVRLSALPMLPDEPIAWLATVVRNLATSQVRSQNRRRRHEAESGWHRAKWLEANDKSNGFAVESDQIQAALMQLSEDCREIMIAHIWNRMTFRQIAEAFGMSPAYS